jgi:hypothetical protein
LRVIDVTAAAIRRSKSKSIGAGFCVPRFGGGDDEFFAATSLSLLALRELLYYFFRVALTAPGLALAAGFAFVATAVTPSTDSFSALAGVKRSRVRAGILICSPVAITTGALARNRCIRPMCIVLWESARTWMMFSLFRKSASSDR